MWPGRPRSKLTLSADEAVEAALVALAIAWGRRRFGLGSGGRGRVRQGADRAVGLDRRAQRFGRAVDRVGALDLERFGQEAAQHVGAFVQIGFALCLADPSRPVVR